MINVLIIEDQSPHYTDIKNDFEKYPTYFNVYPKNNNDEDHDLNNKGYLLDTLLQPKGEGFQSVIEYHSNIDLFIIDATLYQATNDRTGVDFLNFIKKNNYRNCKFNYIITSQHNLENIGAIEPDFDSSIQYVSKSKWGSGFPEEVVRKSILICGINIQENQRVPQMNKNFWQKRWWILLPDDIEKQVIHRLNLLLFYVIILSTGFFALIGIYVETKEQSNKLISLANSDPEINTPDILEYIEHIFLYFLPIFIAFSFLSYYKSTIEIKLTGGNTRNIDHDGAMKSLNNSKFILLSSLLSFTLIKIIENIFERREESITILISYGVFLIILITFILLHHRNTKE